VAEGEKTAHLLPLEDSTIGDAIVL